MCNTVHLRGSVRRGGSRWGMTKKKLDKYQRQLQQLSARLRGDIAALEDEACAPTGGEAGGNLSNAPMHMGDLGTEVYMQELSATLLENENYLLEEIRQALERIQNKSFGVCENCAAPIAAERLEVLPYTRFCVACSEKL